MSEELEQLIEETQRDSPAKTSMDIYTYIEKHKEFVVNRFGGYLKYFEDYFDVLNDIINRLNFAPKKLWPQYKSVMYLMFPETMKTLHRAFEDIVAGYYDEAMILLRSVYETYIKMIFIACYPDDYEAIFKDRKNKRNFNLTNFLKDDLNLDWGFIYRIMSYVAHSKIHIVLARLIKLSKKEDRNPIRLEYGYNEEAISRPINISTFLLCGLFNMMLTIFKGDFKDSQIDQNYSIRIVKIDKVLRKTLERFSNKFKSIVKDIDKVDMIFEEIKSGRNWKKVV